MLSNNKKWKNMKRSKNEIMKDFVDLSCLMSPENISCDGECSQAEVNRKWRKLSKKWHKLESELGRPMSEMEVFDWFTKDNNWKFERRTTV